jgi:hypothetical protein
MIPLHCLLALYLVGAIAMGQPYIEVIVPMHVAR